MKKGVVTGGPESGSKLAPMHGWWGILSSQHPMNRTFLGVHTGAVVIQRYLNPLLPLSRPLHTQPPTEQDLEARRQAAEAVSSHRAHHSNCAAVSSSQCIAAGKGCMDVRLCIESLEWSN